MAEGVYVPAEVGREVICATCQGRYIESELLPSSRYFCKRCVLKQVLCPEGPQEVVLPKGDVESIATLEGAHGEVIQREACIKFGPIVEDSLTKKCPAHKEPLIVYCFDCGSLICPHCTVKDHKGHNLEFNKTAAPDARKKLMEQMKPLRELKVSLFHAVVEVQTTRCELEAQGISVANNIQTSFLELQKILDNHKKDLLEEAARKVQKKMDRLSLQEESLSLACAEVQSILDHIEQCVGHHSDNEFMGMHADLASQIQREVEERDEVVVSLEPVEEVDIGVEVRCAEALQQLCQNMAKLTHLSTVLSDINETADLNNMQVYTLTTVKCNCEVDCHLECLFNGSIIKCNVDQTGARIYIIQYTPTVRGRCELTMSVDGQQVAGSPFTLFVSVPVTQLSKPVSVWRDLPKLSGVAVNSVGEVVVSVCRGDLIIFDNEGKRLRSVKHKLESCGGVAVDGDDIYCIDYDSNKIMRCKRNGCNVKVHKVKQVQGPGHRGVAVVRDEVMMSERGNKGTIMVYDRELKYVRQIAGRGMGEFYNLSTDSHGNLYITDCDDSVITVFSVDGDLLRCFGCDENGVKKLSRPFGVCVAGQYVFVTDLGLCNVAVFTTEGEYITSFGHHGSKEGRFMHPCALSVDRHGFVYVADNNSVQVF